MKRRKQPSIAECRAAVKAARERGNHVSLLEKSRTMQRMVRWMANIDEFTPYQFTRACSLASSSNWINSLQCNGVMIEPAKFVRKTKSGARVSVYKVRITKQDLKRCL